MVLYIIKVIGSFALAILTIALPMLCGLSYALNWISSMKFLLTVLSVIEFFTIWYILYECSDE